MDFRGHFEVIARQDLPPGNGDPVGATDMVEGVRAGGIGGSAAVARDSTRTAGGQFSVENSASPIGQSARPSAVAGIGLDSMLALQAVDEAVERDRSARKRGSAIIAALTNLQRTMLAAEDPSAALRAMSELTTDTPLAHDPGLAAILRAVVLRSRVEIARRELQAEERETG
jgi:hypothetical protein